MTQSKSSSFNIIYRDDDFIAVSKPSGVLCVPGLSTPENLFDMVKNDFPNAKTVHRLDMATSGLVLFALHKESQKRLSQLFATRNIRKRYVAIVNGIVSDDFGEIHSPLICDWPNRPKQKIDWLNGKNASTYFKVVERIKHKNITRVYLKPHTGRTHQLRIHMLQIGHAIVGDAFYATSSIYSSLSPTMLLHAEKLEFQHPITDTSVTLFSPPHF